MIVGRNELLDITICTRKVDDFACLDDVNMVTTGVPAVTVPTSPLMYTCTHIIFQTVNIQHHF